MTRKGGTLQMRMQAGSGKFYSPQRDFAYVYLEMISHAGVLFNASYWPELMRMAARLLGDESPDMEATWDALILARNKYTAFIEHCTDDGNETTKQVLARVGWSEVPPAAQFAWMAMMGCVASGQIVFGRRDVCYSNEPTLDDERAQIVKQLMLHLNQLDSESHALSKLKSDLRQALDCGVKAEEAVTAFYSLLGRRGSYVKQFICWLGRICP